MTRPFDHATRRNIAASCAAFARLPASEPLLALKRAAVAIALTAAEASGSTALLLTLRASGLRAHSNQWALPGGRCDDGETPVEAACRELGEEVGTIKALLLRETRGWLQYDVPSDVAPVYWKGKWRGQAQKWFALAFTGTDADIDIAAHGDEFDGWKWVSVRELLDLIVPFKREVYQAVLKEFADLLSPASP